MKTLTWHNTSWLISCGTSCDRITKTMEKSQNFATESLSCLSPDGACVVMKDPDGTVRVRRVILMRWQIGDVLCSCQQVPEASVLHYAWSPTSALVAVQSSEATSTYQVNAAWSSKRGIQRAIYHHPSRWSQARAMAFSPDGKWIALATPSGVVLWDAISGKIRTEISFAAAQSLAWSPDARYMALGCHDGRVGVYSIRLARLLREWGGQTAAVGALAWSPDGKNLASGDQDGKILLWDTDGDPKKWLCRGPVEPAMPAGIEALAWSSRGNSLAALDSQDQLDDSFQI